MSSAGVHDDVGMLARVIVEKRVRDEIHEISEELETIKLSRPRDVTHVLARIRTLLELDGVGLYSVRNRTGQWEVDRFDAVGPIADALPRLRTMFRNAPEFPLYYHPLTPLAGQRNRVIDALAWIEAHKPGTWDENPMCKQVLRPMGLHRYSQPRALLCRGTTLLGWFGALHSHKPSARQLELLSLLVEPMRRRLAAEEQLEHGHARPALDAALERMGAPAFVLTERGTIVEVNRAGRALLERDRKTVTSALRESVDGRRRGIELEMIPIDEGGGGRLWLAIVAVRTTEERISAYVDRCRLRWALTPRQTEVLARLARGLSNGAIAMELGCVERTVELHVTALFDRAGVDSRAALVARVLTEV